MIKIKSVFLFGMVLTTFNVYADAYEPSHDGTYQVIIHPYQVIKSTQVKQPQTLLTPAKPMWLPLKAHEPIPEQAVSGGGNSFRQIYICRAQHLKDLHPGKLENGYCQILVNGNNVTVYEFQVLVSQKKLRWVPSDSLNLSNMVLGGTINNQRFYICQAEYRNETIPGKTDGKLCYIAWREREIGAPNFKVLVT